MKILLAFLFPFFFQANPSFYSISFEALDGNQVDMATCVNKRVVITEFKASNPDMALIRHLDSLQAINAALQVIMVPALDFGDSLNRPFLDSLRMTLDPAVIMSSPDHVREAAGADQHPLFQWLTDVNENGHFDYDATTQNQIFVVSERGTLFAIIQKESSTAPLDEAIGRTVTQ